MQDVNVLNGPHMQTISDEFLWCHIIHVAIIVTLYTHTKMYIKLQFTKFLDFQVIIHGGGGGSNHGDSTKNAA